MPDFYFEHQLEARGSRAPYVGRSGLLNFFIVFIIASLVSSIPPAAYMVFRSLGGYLDAIQLYGTDQLRLAEEIEKIFNSIYATDAYMIISLFSQAALIAAAVVYCRVFERRSLRSMGLGVRGAGLHYILGIVIGGAMIALSVLPAIALGSLSYTGTGDFKVWVIILFFLGYIVQGAAEEILLRGYFMVSYSSTRRLNSSVLVSSILFALLHLGNNGAGVIGIINTFLFGAFLAYYFIRTKSLFGACAIHTAWNFIQGHVFGISVSGMPLYDSFFRFAPTGRLSVISGGIYGIEGGLTTTVVLVIALALVIFIPTKREYVEL